MLALSLAVSLLPSAPEPIVIDQMLVVERVQTPGRVPIVADPIASRLVRGTWRTPVVGEAVRAATGEERSWRALKADGEGWIGDAGTPGGYGVATFASDRDRVMLLEATGTGMTYFNGVPRSGDVYAYGYVRLPVEVRRGTNELLVTMGRGRVRARLVDPHADVEVHTTDPTLPDLVVGGSALPGAVVVSNNTPRTVRGELRATIDDETRLTPVSLPPMTVRKLGFPLPDHDTRPGVNPRLAVAFVPRGEVSTGPPAVFELGAKGPEETHKRTFVSGIDGSVQYYGVVPARPVGPAPADALAMTLHGASVEAIGQAQSYGAKSWVTIVAPTNRRPFGFNWEDWGRMDALEVRDDAVRVFRPDPSRVFLTGHSMGGHGTWIIGAQFPDQWAAIGPAAGWIDYWHYGGAVEYPDPDPVQQVLLRASNASRTLQLERNYRHHGVFVLHGDADETVPVAQARKMRERLAGFHRDFDWHEEPGGGHWYDVSDETGVDCQDFPGLWDFFARRVIPRPDEVRNLEFTTVSPAINARSQWVTVSAQQSPLEPSTFEGRFDFGVRRVTGTTKNVLRIELDYGPLGSAGPVGLVLDGQEFRDLPWPQAGILRLERGADGWAVTPGWSAWDKKPARNGPFKEAMRNRMVFVYGTRGSAAENSAMYAKARYDAEVWWYQGNGWVPMIPDTAFSAAAFPDRGVVLYGNADTNAAYRELLPEAPVRIARGAVTVGERTWRGDDLAALFCYPRRDSDTAMVAVVGGTGLVGTRATWRIPYFTAGTHYPDYLVFGADMLERGTDGIRAAGFFGVDWSLDGGFGAAR